MNLNRKELRILTYFTYGAWKKNLIQNLHNFFGYEKAEIMTIVKKLISMKYIEEIKQVREYYSTGKIKRDELDDEVLFILEGFSKYKTYKEFIIARKAHTK